MGRRKLPLELIPNEKARRITYEMRKRSMMKKAQEFTTLCGVNMCMIIYDPTRSSATAAAAEPEVWPTSPKKVKRIIKRSMSEGPDRRAKRTIGLPEFFVNRKRKVDAELMKAQLANWEAEYPISEELIGDLSKEDLKSLLGSLGHKLEAAKARLAMMKEDAMRRSSHMYDHDIHANDHIYGHHHMRGLFQDQCLFGDVRPGQKLPFCHPGGDDAFGDVLVWPHHGHMSMEDTPSFGMCYDALMVQPVPPPCRSR